VAADSTATNDATQSPPDLRLERSRPEHSDRLRILSSSREQTLPLSRCAVQRRRYPMPVDAKLVKHSLDAKSAAHVAKAW
jgi:hypothetical protein